MSMLNLSGAADAPFNSPTQTAHQFVEVPPIEVKLQSGARHCARRRRADSESEDSLMMGHWGWGMGLLGGLGMLLFWGLII